MIIRENKSNSKLITNKTEYYCSKINYQQNWLPLPQVLILKIDKMQINTNKNKNWRFFKNLKRSYSFNTATTAWQQFDQPFAQAQHHGGRNRHDRYVGGYHRRGDGPRGS